MRRGGGGVSSESGPARWPSEWPFSPGGSGPVGRAMVATTDRYASEAGVAVLAAGGNAIDAAVAAAFALAVVNPEAGNLGGSGFLLARMADGRTEAFDYRGVAPLAATAPMFLDETGAVSDRSQLGPLAAAVPGSVKGLWEAHRALGSRPWASLVEPAIELARGFRVRERLMRSYPPHIVEGLRRFPGSERIFLPEGRVPRLGETLRQPDLAATLERIRDRGADGFYRGETARRLVEAMRRDGGILEPRRPGGLRGRPQGAGGVLVPGPHGPVHATRLVGRGRARGDRAHAERTRPGRARMARGGARPPPRRGMETGVRGPEPLHGRHGLRGRARRRADVSRSTGRGEQPTSQIGRRLPLRSRPASRAARKATTPPTSRSSTRVGMRSR